MSCIPAMPTARALLPLAQQAERRAFLGADRVAAALAAGDRDDAGLQPVILEPLAERRDREGLVVGMRADEEDVELHRLLLRACGRADRRNAREQDERSDRVESSQSSHDDRAPFALERHRPRTAHGPSASVVLRRPGTRVAA